MTALYPFTFLFKSYRSYSCINHAISRLLHLSAVLWYQSRFFFSNTDCPEYYSQNPINRPYYTFRTGTDSVTVTELTNPYCLFTNLNPCSLFLYLKFLSHFSDPFSLLISISYLSHSYSKRVTQPRGNYCTYTVVKFDSSFILKHNVVSYCTVTKETLQY